MAVGMLTLPDGRILYVTGDGLPFGMSGRSSSQDPNSHLSKLFISLILRMVQSKSLLWAPEMFSIWSLPRQKETVNKVILVLLILEAGTAEEINFVSLPDLLDTSEIENFGWGTNPDGLAREGTYYVGPGQAFTFGTPPVSI